MKPLALIHKLSFGCILLAACGDSPVRANDRELLGRWLLAGDTKDSSGHGNDGENHGADLTAHGRDGKRNGAASFNGTSAFIQIPSRKSLNLGKSDFTLALWIRIDKELDDTIGDVVSKFDPVARCGFSLCVKNGPGTSGSQANYRNVQFGIDAGTKPKWTDCGRPGNTVYVMALAVHDEELFAGTCEPGKDEAGHVYRYSGGDRWIDCGSPDRSNAVTCLASYDGKLYAGTGRYRTSGSALPDSPNNTPGGKLFSYAGDRRWINSGQLNAIDAIGGMLVYRGQLYATSMYHPSGMFRYDGGHEWLPCSLPKDSKRVVSPIVFNGYVYATTYDGCAVYRYDGDKWSDAMKLEPSGQTYSLEVHAGHLYVGTWPSGHVYRSDDGQKWSDTGRLGHEDEVMAMAVHNGKLYAGTLPLAQVYRFDGGTNWTFTGQLDHAPAVRFRRAWSMAIYQGRLFCGTLPSGHVHALDAGASVTCDRELAAGWKHLAAVREGDHLKLFIDGKQAATSLPLNPAEFDLLNDQPIKIGFGGHDYFHGSLCDLRLYGRALTTDEIANLATVRGQ